MWRSAWPLIRRFAWTSPDAQTLLKAEEIRPHQAALLKVREILGAEGIRPHLVTKDVTNAMVGEQGPTESCREGWSQGTTHFSQCLSRWEQKCGYGCRSQSTQEKPAAASEDVKSQAPEQELWVMQKPTVPPESFSATNCPLHIPSPAKGATNDLHERLKFRKFMQLIL